MNLVVKSTHAMLCAMGAILLVPFAAATDTERDRDYYLRSDAEGRLSLSALPPSAKNTTTWTVKLPTDQGRAEKRVLLAFPDPDFVVGEEVGITGTVRANAERVSSDPAIVYFENYAARIQVWLVEGDREVLLGDKRLSRAAADLDLEGDFPGHGDDASPHTHGDGDDPDRGLFLHDLRAKIVLLVEWRWPAQTDALAQPAEIRFSIHIDGRSFLQVDAAGDAMEEDEGGDEAGGEAPTQPPTDTPTTGDNETENCTEVPDNETSPQPTTSGSGAGASASARATFALGAAATAGLGLYTLRRERPKP